MITLTGKYCRDCKIFIDDVEQSAMELIYNIINSPAFDGSKIRIMPDTHAGKGIVIGFTAPLDKFVAPSHVGVDIGCTIDTWFTNVNYDDIDPVKLERDIRKTVKFGLEHHEKSQTTTKDFCKFVNGYMRTWRSAWPEQIQQVNVTEKYVSDLCKRIGMEEALFWKSLGTVGGGNHMLEIGIHNDLLCYTIHCGSRNLGVKIANYHEKIAARPVRDSDLKRALRDLAKKLCGEGRKTEIDSELKKLKEEYLRSKPNGYLVGQQMSDYLTDMAFGVAYALYNHEVISKLILGELKKQVRSAKITDMIRSIHNYVDFTDHIIRKGAIRAYEGELCVIPFNMRDGLAICRGKGNADWNWSAPHGTGRVMSRAAAKKNLSVEEFRKQMEGITSTSVGPGTIDEAPDAYKSADLIKSLVGDTVEILYTITPWINMKDKNTAAED